MEHFIYELFAKIENIPQLYLYLFTFVSGLIQVAFPPYPGELVLALGGCIEAKKHLMESLTLFATYWSAIVTANYLLYELGRNKGEAILKNRHVARFISVENHEKIKLWLGRFGLFVFLTAIYVPGMYLPVVFFSGVMKFKRRYALPGMMLATAIHDILLFMGGRYAGHNLQKISAFLCMYRNAAMGIAGAVLLFCAVYLVFRQIRKKARIVE